MAARLSFGYIYDMRNPQQWSRPPEDLYADMLDIIVETERLGFGSAWIPEHHLAEDGYVPSPLTVLSAIAARTSTITIGSAIALAPLYNPVRFAEDCAMLDILSNGRAEMGLAIGYRRREYEAFGLDFTTRGKRFDEFLQIVRSLWAGDTVTFQGRHFSITEARVSPLSSRGQIPLYIGGFVGKALERAAKYGDGYYGNAEYYDTYVAKLKAHGKDPSSAGILIPDLFNMVARDPEAAMEELAPHYHHASNAYGAWMNEDKAIGMDDAALAPMDLDAFKQSGIFRVWTPDEAISRLKAMQAKMNLKHYVMMAPPGLPRDRFLAYAQDFAADVIPAFN